LAANAELPAKVVKFVNNLVAGTNIDITPPLCVLLSIFSSSHSHGTNKSSNSHPECNASKLRAEVESLNRELFNAELQLDVLLRAVTLSKKNIQRIVEKRDTTISFLNDIWVPPQLPTEIVMQTAGYLRWDDDSDAVSWGGSYRDGSRDSYSSLRWMASAFSVVDGMDVAILRNIPLVLFQSKVGSGAARWTDVLEDLPISQREIIGEDPRFCLYDDEDAISCISPDEEIHLILFSEYDTPEVSVRLFQMFHISLVFSDEESALGN